MGNIYGALYASVHCWLRYHYGRADRCENKNCQRKVQSYNWCKIKGKDCDYKRENFIQLCRSCHSKYDRTEESNEKNRQGNPNTHKTHCIRGHKFTPENTYLLKYKKGRTCLACKADYQRKWRKTEAFKEFTKKNKEKHNQYAKEYWRRHYGKGVKLGII